MGISTYAPDDNPTYAYDIDSDNVRQMREQLGGQLVPATVSKIRWYMSDLEAAERLADTGDLSQAGRLMLAARKDGVLSGVLSTRTSGLVRLPKRFRGDPKIVSELEAGHESVRSTFDEMCPPSELALMAADGVLCGVAIGELLPVQGRTHPVLVRLDPQYLSYVWNENRFYYRSAVGRLPVTPGDGRWVLHVPGGRVAPWQHALWRAVGRAYIRKEHANLQKDNWESKLANPARVAVAPQGAAEAQKQSFFQQVMAWGINSVFGMTPGFDVKLIESNGRGFDSFNKTITQQNEEFIIAIAGQIVTTTGGSGFANADIHKAIRADLIKDTADGLAYTVNTQIIPVYIALSYGEDAITTMSAAMEWDVTPPQDLNAQANSVLTLANAIIQMQQALATGGYALDITTMAERYGVPLEGDYDGDGVPDTDTGKPKLRVIEGGKSTTAADTDTVGDVAPTDAAVAADKAAQDTALNGAQIASLLEIIQAVADGLIPRDSGLAIIKRAFLVDDAGAEELMGSVGQGFVSSTAAPPAPPPGAPQPPAAPTEQVAA
jgi:phage gp29-like protein